MWRVLSLAVSPGVWVAVNASASHNTQHWLEKKCSIWQLTWLLIVVGSYKIYCSNIEYAIIREVCWSPESTHKILPALATVAAHELLCDYTLPVLCALPPLLTFWSADMLKSNHLITIQYIFKSRQRKFKDNFMKSRQPFWLACWCLFVSLCITIPLKAVHLALHENIGCLTVLFGLVITGYSYEKQNS